MIFFDASSMLFPGRATAQAFDIGHQAFLPVTGLLTGLLLARRSSKHPTEHRAAHDLCPARKIFANIFCAEPRDHARIRNVSLPQLQKSRKISKERKHRPSVSNCHQIPICHWTSQTLRTGRVGRQIMASRLSTGSRKPARRTGEELTLCGAGPIGNSCYVCASCSLLIPSCQRASFTDVGLSPGTTIPRY